MRAALACLVILPLSACPDESGSEGPNDRPAHLANPSGLCKPTGNGARAGYHAPADSLWLPDCQNPLAREYFRVFTESATSAYVIPRPDGSPYLEPVCSDPQHELHALVERHALCAVAASEAAVARVNSIPPADALRIARYLHGRLKWHVVDEAGAGINPYPLPSDIVDACDLDAPANSAAFESLCQRERDRLASGFDIGFSYEGPGAVELAARLNQLYGIEP
jgi:hypothetical protein